MTKRFKIIAGVGTIIITILAATTLGRGWIRGTAIPAYVNLVYKNSLNKSFDQAFSTINPKLAVYGINFQPSKYNQDVCEKGANVYYQGVRETIPCSRSRSSSLYHVSPEFIKKWQLSSQSLEDSLLGDGWIKQWNKDQPINQIYNSRNDHLNTTISVVYGKYYGHTYCELSINYQPNRPHAGEGEAFANEACDRDVILFGGN